MNKIKIDAVFKLRRDNDYNYAKIADTFIPENGEVCLVDTAQNGLRAKIGDGVRIFANLPFADEDISKNVIVRGYLFNNQFYFDADLTIVIEPSVNKIYIDVVKSVAYIYDNGKYTAITQTITAASATIAGVMKLYDTVGQNTDGTMTQKAITDELDDKIEMQVNANEELVIFATNID